MMRRPPLFRHSGGPRTAIRGGSGTHEATGALVRYPISANFSTKAAPIT